MTIWVDTVLEAMGQIQFKEVKLNYRSKLDYLKPKKDEFGKENLEKRTIEGFWDNGETVNMIQQMESDIAIK